MISVIYPQNLTALLPEGRGDLKQQFFRIISGFDPLPKINSDLLLCSPLSGQRDKTQLLSKLVDGDFSASFVVFRA